MYSIDNHESRKDSRYKKKKILTLYFPPETGASLHTIVSSIDSS
jgi:hypothetical protein